MELFKEIYKEDQYSNKEIDYNYENQTIVNGIQNVGLTKNFK